MELDAQMMQEQQDEIENDNNLEMLDVGKENEGAGNGLQAGK